MLSRRADGRILVKVLVTRVNQPACSSSQLGVHRIKVSFLLRVPGGPEFSCCCCRSSNVIGVMVL